MKLKYLLIIIAAALIIFRIALPDVLIYYVENQVNKIPGYRVKIADLDVHLYRGSYTIKDLQLWKVNKNIPVPFFAANAIDLSIEWRALFHGKLVAKILADKPVLHFVTAAQAKNEQLTIDDQWLSIVKSLFPLNINRLEAAHGEIYFENLHDDPPFKTYVKDVRFEMTNMQNAKRKTDKLSSKFKFDGKVMNGGEITLNGKFDPFAKRPTFYLQSKLNALEIARLRGFLQHYTKVKVAHGTFSLYAEAAAAQGKITGYAKPFIKNLKISDEHNTATEAIYNGAAKVVASILENPNKKTIATRVKLEGNVDDPDVSVWSIIGYLLKHAFIQALIPQIDHSVEMKDVVYKSKRA